MLRNLGLCAGIPLGFAFSIHTPQMKTIALLLICIGTGSFAADAPKPADAASTIATATNTPPRRASRDSANSNDVFYTLGPDSRPRDGVPKGRYTEAKVIPSNVFPGTQHTYWVYVPAQYDPAIPAAVMIFMPSIALANSTRCLPDKYGVLIA